MVSSAIRYLVASATISTTFGMTAVLFDTELDRVLNRSLAKRLSPEVRAMKYRDHNLTPEEKADRTKLLDITSDYIKKGGKLPWERPLNGVFEAIDGMARAVGVSAPPRPRKNSNPHRRYLILQNALENDVNFKLEDADIRKICGMISQEEHDKETAKYMKWGMKQERKLNKWLESQYATVKSHIEVVAKRSKRRITNFMNTKRIRNLDKTLAKKVRELMQDGMAESDVPIKLMDFLEFQHFHHEDVLSAISKYSNEQAIVELDEWERRQIARLDQFMWNQQQRRMRRLNLKSHETFVKFDEFEIPAKKDNDYQNAIAWDVNCRHMWQ